MLKGLLNVKFRQHELERQLRSTVSTRLFQLTADTPVFYFDLCYIPENIFSHKCY